MLRRVRKGKCTVIVLILFWSLVEVHSQIAPYVRFMGDILPNHAYVDLTTVGDDINSDPGDTVRCHTDLETCCTGNQGIHRGDWYFPDGSVLPFASSNGDIVLDREPQEVLIRRRNNAMSPTGIYHCVIETNAVNDDDFDTITGETVYLGLYLSSGGDVTISDDVTLTVDSDLNGANPQFTLTCISTGGPATTVTWTRDSGNITEGTETVLNDPVTAQYTHTLTVTERLGGLYTCTVTNNKPSSDSANITLEVSAQEDDIILVRTEPDPTSQELPCANQRIVYECQQLISSNDLTWTLPNNEILRFSQSRDINDTETSDDDKYIATLTNKTEGEVTDTFLFTSTLMILEPVNGSTVTCTGGTTTNLVSGDTTIVLSGPPDPPTDLSYDNTVIIESSVDLQWNRSSYTGGVSIVNYIVSIDDMNIMNTSNEMITLTLHENINDDIHLLVTAINLCGSESEPATITIPTEAPPNIVGLMSMEFSCNISLVMFPVKIIWTPGSRIEGVIYPGETMVSVRLDPESTTDEDIVCSDMTTTTCTAVITRDIYTVIVNQTNNIGSTVDILSLDSRILIPSDEMLSGGVLSLSVTLSVNELCPSDTSYPVLVTFGTQPVDGGDCVGQMNATMSTISSGDSPVTFSVAGNSICLGYNEVYCYVINDDTVIINTPDVKEDDSPSLSTGGAVAIAIVLTLLVSLPVGIIIGMCLSRCISKSRGIQEKEQQLQEGTNVVIYEEPDVKIETDIPLSDNQAYSHVNMQRRRN